MHNRVGLFLGLVMLAGGAQAQRVIAAATPSVGDRLPVRHVALYKNGVGYFEHDGKVHGNQSVTIAFTTAQLNDVLKSLTAIDLNGGRIADVSYNSTAPLEQRLNTLQLPIGEKTTTAEFLDALRGARVEVSSGSSSAVGRLLSVETVTTPASEDEKKSSPPATHTQLALVTDSGELRTFLLSPQTNVHLLESDLNQEVGRYLSLIASTRAADVRKMTIATEGNGDREVSVSYISEVPIWKSTYRIVIPSGAGQKPLLQGWAVVDNTVGEDWDNVELSLIAGAPQSFVQEISQPYYARRPVVGLPELAMLTPQTHEQTLQAALSPPPPPPVPPPTSAEVVGGGAMDSYGGPVKSKALNGTGQGVGGGMGGGIFGAVLRNDSPRREGETRDVADVMESQQPSASTHDLGDVFEYKINHPVTIHKNQSALVPILQARIDAEKVTLWSPREPRALRALWLSNSSGVTLDGGSFSIQEAQTFAGEGLMDAIRPGEKRLISYAADPAIQVKSEVKGEGQRATLVRIHRGVLFEESQEREHHKYIIRNQDASVREVVIEHPERKGWELTGAPKPEETSASAYRFRVKVDPAQTSALEFDEVHSFGTSYALTNITPDQIAIFVRQGWANDKIEAALRPIIQQKNEIAGFDQRILSTKSKISAIFDDQKRLRENLAPLLKGGTEMRSLAERYTGELNREEDELASLRKDLASLQAQHETASQKLNDMIQTLEMEMKI